MANCPKPGRFSGRCSCENAGGRGDEAAMNKTNRPLRLLSVLVLLSLAGASVALSVVVRSIVQDQEGRMLKVQSAQGAILVGSLFGGAQDGLKELATVHPPEIGSTDNFLDAARPKLGLVSTIGAFRQENGVTSVLGAVGVGPTTGQTVDSDRAALAARARSREHVVSAVVETDLGRRVSFALGLDDGLVLYEDMAFDPGKPFDVGDLGPFSDLDGALYASSQADPAALVLTTAVDLPLSGRVERQMVEIGTEKWLLETKSKRPLIGAFADNAPWGVLFAGLLAAGLTTILVETLSRRRAYALRLVDERTVELREAREVADAANRSKSEFLSRMSHELRTPLNAVLGFGQLLELDDLTDSQQEAVEQIVKGGRHLVELINEVLDISLIETGTLGLSPEPVPVGDVVTDTVSMIRSLADARGIEVVVDAALTEDAHVLADRQRLKQVLLNLLGNAIKYNRDGGRVTVSCTRADDGGRMRINVADTGPGIYEESIERLFVPFERLGAERTEVEGAGVGLALSRRLAEAMGGTLDMTSVVGEGSTFWIELPVVDGLVDQYDQLHRDGAEHTSFDDGTVLRHKIVYIEDNVSNVRLVERVLARRGDIELIPAMQGRLGVALARELQPSLVLLDVHLPDVDGNEVLAQLRADPLTATIPVVIVSADATDGQIDRLLAAGANAYVTKPIEVHELLAVIDRLLTAAPLPS